MDFDRKKLYARCQLALFGTLLLFAPGGHLPTALAELQHESPIDFNRDIRSILSNNCFKCHGPDAQERQGGIDGYRLDTKEGALEDLGGYVAILPGNTEESELVRRITSDDPDERMPPVDSGKKLTQPEIALITQWISQGAPFAQHWSYVKPVRPELPKLNPAHASGTNQSDNVAAIWRAWPNNGIDYFVLDRLLREGLSPSPESDRSTLIRRMSLDLTGLPPTPQEVEQFVNDTDPRANEKLVDRLLDSPAYGEHWARLWLDLARYADSAGYADDPARTIWAYRDYVIQSLNNNKRFDQFTIEQLAGDLLPNPTEEQLIATGFHRNTMTNNEGGTSDEEFRNVAIIDRVNTTMAVWMGTTIACAQCHDHKYDPITQKDFFRLFAILNNTADADRRDESPLLELWTEEQKQKKAQWQTEIDSLEIILTTPTPELAAAQAKWEERFAVEPQWKVLLPAEFKSQAGANVKILQDSSLLVTDSHKTDTYTLVSEIDSDTNLTGIQLQTLPEGSLIEGGAGHSQGNFVITRILLHVSPPKNDPRKGRYVRIDIPGNNKILSLAEVQVFQGDDNIANLGKASQSSTAFAGLAKFAVDGNTDGLFSSMSTTHTEESENPWWELDLGSEQAIDRIVLWNRTDGDLQSRLKGFRITLLDKNRRSIWEKTTTEFPNPSAQYSPNSAQNIEIAAAGADYSQKDFAAENVLDSKTSIESGWAVSPQQADSHKLTLVLKEPKVLRSGASLAVTIEQRSKLENHTLGHFRLATTGDSQLADHVKTPTPILAILKIAPDQRSQEQQTSLTKHYLGIAPLLEAERSKATLLKKQLAELKPRTTVPIMRELPDGKRRITRIQRRGNYLQVGDEVSPGVPKAFAPLPQGVKADRLGLARWLVADDNPLTARVLVNRYWEAIFGVGIVSTSEEFGSQGDLPSHPELLDWLAVELVESHWDLKHLLKTMVTSATYRQSSRVTPAKLLRDPDNRLLSRGPRFRLSAEMIRDQALFISGLWSNKMYGPSVNPFQPATGLNAAFGSGIDWKTSKGEDRYRRGLYTTWRRSNPYPSMVAFDAPNREVCTIHRGRTNTPLQALVTLNDPVYVEAAQALARRLTKVGDTPDSKIRYAFRLCLSRPPNDSELADLVELYVSTYLLFSNAKERAIQMATDPLGPIDDGEDVTELAALTVVANVLLNLDEVLMKR